MRARNRSFASGLGWVPLVHIVGLTIGAPDRVDAVRLPEPPKGTARCEAGRSVGRLVDRSSSLVAGVVPVRSGRPPTLPSSPRLVVLRSQHLPGTRGTSGRRLEIIAPQAPIPAESWLPAGTVRSQLGPASVPLAVETQTRRRRNKEIA